MGPLDSDAWPLYLTVFLLLCTCEGCVNGISIFWNMELILKLSFFSSFLDDSVVFPCKEHSCMPCDSFCASLING